MPPIASSATDNNENFIFVFAAGRKMAVIWTRVASADQIWRGELIGP
jgi:hypothetical protein